jgi:anthranilate synthase/aminodeoxychorismate synthase-like glutamine amidotransferase
MRLLMVDNYDSFTHNLVQALAALGAQVEVVRNRDPRLMAPLWQEVDGVVVSPGPGVPSRSGHLPAFLRALRQACPSLPALGVCLGLQAMAECVGGRLRQVEPVHGEARPVVHRGEGLLAGLPTPFPAGRYHSWAVEEGSSPSLEVTARSPDGVVMAARFAGTAWEGLQFHPESVLTPLGPAILEAFVRRCAA